MLWPKRYTLVMMREQTFYAGDTNTSRFHPTGKQDNKKATMSIDCTFYNRFIRKYS